MRTQGEHLPPEGQRDTRFADRVYRDLQWKEGSSNESALVMGADECSEAADETRKGTAWDIKLADNHGGGSATVP